MRTDSLLLALVHALAAVNAVERLKRREDCGLSRKIAGSKKQLLCAPLAEFLCSAALDEIAEQRGHLTGFFVPLFPGAERLVIVLGKQNVHLALLQQAPEVLAGLAAVGVVIAGHDTRRYFDGFELLLGGADHRKIRAFEEILAPMRHDLDETLWLELHQSIAIFRARCNALFPVLHIAHCGHAARFRRGDELAVVFFGEALACKTSSGDAPKQKAANRLRMTERE